MNKRTLPVRGRPSPRWALFSRFDIYGPNGEIYLRRLRIVQTPWFAVLLHKILQTDPEDLHDHPWPFVSIVLRRGYDEIVETKPLTCRRVRWISFKRSTSKHRISWLPPGGAWTLVLCGPRVRRWGFHTRAGWVPAREYTPLNERKGLA